jgi:hypothetical protein
MQWKIKRQDAEMQRRKGKRREWNRSQRSPFSDPHRQCQLVLRAFAALRLCVEIAVFTEWIRLRPGHLRNGDYTPGAVVTS